MLSRDELAAWLRLATTPGIGRAVARQLLAALGSPERVLAADERTLQALVGPDVARLLKRRDARDDAHLDTTRRWLDSATGEAARDIVVLGDPRYPALLLRRPTRPCCCSRWAGWRCCRRPASPSWAAAARRLKAWTTRAPSPAS